MKSRSRSRLILICEAVVVCALFVRPAASQSAAELREPRDAAANTQLRLPAQPVAPTTFVAPLTGVPPSSPPPGVAESAAKPVAHPATAGAAPVSLALPEGLLAGPESWTSPEGLSSTLQVMLLLSVLSLAPAALLMTTCFVRIVVVLSLLRQALGAQQLPPGQVITSISLFLTLLIMAPVWKEVYDQAIVPYSNEQIDLQTAWEAGSRPIRRFMSQQIEKTNNGDDVRLFVQALPESQQADYQYYEDVPLVALAPAFMISELKTAFLIGFQVYLPFLILDMVISSVLVSMGMLMLPPVLISLPFKLMLFVLVDGWRLVVGMLLSSFQAYV
ncbi:MAG TPA: flagellar type III secretion system pore protein FliP [Pirellulales bacterium]